MAAPRIAVIACLFLSGAAAAEPPAVRLWAELKARREALPGVHQAFDGSTTVRTAGGPQASRWHVQVDRDPSRWREIVSSGSGSYQRLCDGKDIVRLEVGGDEFERVRPDGKSASGEPAPYNLLGNLDWSRSADLGVVPCALPGLDGPCIAIEAPLKPRMGTPTIRMTKGLARLVVHRETGLLVTLRWVENFEHPGGGYQVDTAYALKRVSLGAPPDSLFRLPAEAREVKELTAWNANRIRKQLAGQPAPELEAMDIRGRPFRLSDHKGKVVLLDFWTTWCPPCRTDGPSLNKLYRKHGGKGLEVVGISVSEDRSVVESFLTEHRYEFPVVLTTENPMARPYQVATFPTYVVIDREGRVVSAAEGDQGLSGIRKLLKKAGLDAD
ncbi:MAG TPA: hypothetical protein DEH78_01240 [Solibacterales bacterium]|nr:hypothetical protein [Bryobacterales bacterium]